MSVASACHRHTHTARFRAVLGRRCRKIDWPCCIVPATPLGLSAVLSRCSIAARAFAKSRVRTLRSCLGQAQKSFIVPVFYLGANDINFTLMMGQHQDYEIAIDVARQIRNQSQAHFAYSSLQGAGMTWIRDGDGFVNSDHIVRIVEDVPRRQERVGPVPGRRHHRRRRCLFVGHRRAVRPTAARAEQECPNLGRTIYLLQARPSQAPRGTRGLART